MSNEKDPKDEVAAAREAFEKEFAPFTGLTAGASGLILSDAQQHLSELRELRTRHLGKKSAIASCKKLIGRVEGSERAAFGQLVQQTEAALVEKTDAAEQALTAFIQSARISRESIDVTIPGVRPAPGHIHPITLMRQRIEDIFVSLGYAVEDDREIETDFYNFDALNIPEGHPAR